jgi:uncharacterized protein with HEPN domain
VNDADLLTEIEDVLQQIDGLLPTEQQAWQQDAVRQLSIERLWILAGNAAERYRRSADLSGGVDPWSALYEFRNVLAHQTPSERRPLRVWEEGLSDLPALLGDVRAARNQR